MLIFGYILDTLTFFHCYPSLHYVSSYFYAMAEVIQEDKIKK